MKLGEIATVTYGPAITEGKEFAGIIGKIIITNPVYTILATDTSHNRLNTYTVDGKEYTKCCVVASTNKIIPVLKKDQETLEQKWQVKYAALRAEEAVSLVRAKYERETQTLRDKLSQTIPLPKESEEMYRKRLVIFYNHTARNYAYLSIGMKAKLVIDKFTFNGMINNLPKELVMKKNAIICANFNARGEFVEYYLKTPQLHVMPSFHASSDYGNICIGGFKERPKLETKDILDKLIKVKDLLSIVNYESLMMASVTSNSNLEKVVNYITDIGAKYCKENSLCDECETAWNQPIKKRCPCYQECRNCGFRYNTYRVETDEGKNLKIKIDECFECFKEQLSYCTECCRSKKHKENKIKETPQTKESAPRAEEPTIRGER